MSRSEVVGNPTNRIYWIPSRQVIDSGIDVIEKEKPLSFVTKALSGFDDLLKDYGYTVQRGKGDLNDPLQIGFDSGQFPDDPVAFYKELAKAAQVRVPKEFTPKEILRTNDRVMAKIIGEHQGYGKFLLENLDEKVRFLAVWLNYPWIMKNSNITPSGDFWMSQALQMDIQRILEEVKEGTTFIKKRKGYKNLKQRVAFQEFIESPSNYYTSYRVLSDAAGNIYYTALIISPNRKSKEYLEYQKKENSPVTFQDVKYKIVDSDTNLLTLIYSHPQSPFYLHAQSAVSYIHDRSEELILVGQKIKDPFLRLILSDHGIDPDHAKAPQELLEMGRRLGVAMRLYNPWGGFDFVQSANNGKYYFMEGNHKPALAPAGFNKPPNTSDQILERTIMERLLNTLQSK